MVGGVTVRRQLALWSQGAETVRVYAQGDALVIEHRVTSESRARSLTLPLARGLLVALRAGLEQIARGVACPQPKAPAIKCDQCSVVAVYADGGRHYCDDHAPPFSTPVWGVVEDVPMSNARLARYLSAPVDNLTTLAIRRAVLAAVEMTKRGEDVRAMMVEVSP